MRIEKILWLIIFILIIGCQSNLDKLKKERNLLRGLKLAQKLDKPIFLHFTGYMAANNEFHNDLIESNKILKKLNKEFVTVELFVDDKREFKVSDTLNLHKLGLSNKASVRIKKAKSIGKINSTIQNDWLKSNTQPLYLIIDSKRNILVEPFGYISRNRELFLAKLNKGLDNFEKENRVITNLNKPIPNTDNSLNKCDSIFETGEEMPKFKGGDLALMKYNNENIIPIIEKSNTRKGTIISKLNYSLIISKEGKIITAEIITNIGKELKDELENELVNMPNWIAGKVNEKDECMKIRIPISCLKYQ